MQPCEFFELLEGFEWRKDQRQGEFAYFTHWFVNSMVAKPISPADILKPLKGEKQEQQKTKVEDLQERFKHVLANGGESK